MAFPGTNGTAATPAATWAFNPPPGWPTPPPGWQPPEGWQPEPSWPPAPAGWNFWVPAATSYGHQTSPFAGEQFNRPHPPALSTVLGTLFPVSNWLHNPGWRQWTRLLLIPYALLPLIYLIVFNNSTNPSTPGWAYALYVAPLWIGGFWLLIRPGRLGPREFWIAVGVIAWTVIWLLTVTVWIEDAWAGGPKIGIGASFVVGFDEEITKALPILVIGLILKGRKIRLDVRMWMFMGTIAGLAFGVVEASAVYSTLNTYKAIGDFSQYLSTQGGQISVAQAINIEISFFLNFAERVFVDGLQHAVWAGISAFFIGIAINYRKRRITIIALGIVIPAVLHALNDFTVGGDFTGALYQWVWILIQAVSVVLFLSYTMSAHSIEETVRESPVFRGQSMILDIAGLRQQASQQGLLPQAGSLPPPGGQPGFQGGQQPGFQGQQPGFQGAQPGFQGAQPGFQPAQPGFQPAQPGFQGGQPAFQPAQPGFQPAQSPQQGTPPGQQQSPGQQPPPGHQPPPGQQPPGQQPPGYRPDGWA